jgi:hypothetical protein
MYLLACRPHYPVVEDKTITQRENDLLAESLRGSFASQALLPLRPGYGVLGQQLLVWTNYFQLALKDPVYFRYDAKIKSGKKDAPRGVAKRILELLISDHINLLNIDAVSDMRSTVITRQSLDDSLNYRVLYRAEGETHPEDNAMTYDVALTLSGTLNLSDLVDYSTSTSSVRSIARNQELLQALNIVVGYKSRTDPHTVAVGRTGRVSKASDQPRVSLGGGLEALRSFVFSVRAATERVLVNVQVKSLPFLVPVPLAKLVNDFKIAGGTPQSLGPFLRLVSVEVTHIRRRAKSGAIVPRYKTILSLASQRDGNKLSHPPRIARNGANAKEVEFWLEDAGSVASDGPSGETPNKGKEKAIKSRQGSYISVFDFFQTSKLCCSCVNVRADRDRAQHYHSRPISAGPQCGNHFQPVLPAHPGL